MKPPPRLRVELRPSRIARGALVAGAASIAALMLVLPLDPWLAASALLGTIALTVRGLRRCAGRGVPAFLHVGLDRRLTVTGRDGRSRDGAILDDSYVGARLTTIVWRPDGAAWYLPSRTIMILPDMLPADDFRRLRVRLRYGRPGSKASTSGLEAG